MESQYPVFSETLKSGLNHSLEISHYPKASNAMLVPYFFFLVEEMILISSIHRKMRQSFLRFISFIKLRQHIHAKMLLLRLTPTSDRFFSDENLGYLRLHFFSDENMG